MNFTEFAKAHEGDVFDVKVEDTRNGKKNIGNTVFERVPLFVSGGGVAIKWEQGHHSNGMTSAFFEAKSNFPLSFSPYVGEYNEDNDSYHFDIDNFNVSVYARP